MIQRLELLETDVYFAVDKKLYPLGLSRRKALMRTGDILMHAGALLMHAGVVLMQRFGRR